MRRGGWEIFQNRREITWIFFQYKLYVDSHLTFTSLFYGKEKLNKIKTCEQKCEAGW